MALWFDADHRCHGRFSKTRLSGGTLDERSSRGVEANSQAPRAQLARTTNDMVVTGYAGRKPYDLAPARV
jgi:hypothetical protein